MCEFYITMRVRHHISTTPVYSFLETFHPANASHLAVSSVVERENELVVELPYPHTFF